ncbi:MAG: hypothetical protein IPQ13_07735 [Holophagaceae bacterium]|nr:hypothetical protein [Holophagaceae bacterium]
MSDTLLLEVTTPYKNVFCGHVPEVQFSTRYREKHSILPGHTPWITLVGSGLLWFTIQGQEHWMTLIGGIVEVHGNKVAILARLSETVGTRELNALWTAKRMAEKALREARNELSRANAKVALERSLVSDGVVDLTMLLAGSHPPLCTRYGCETCQCCSEKCHEASPPGCRRRGRSQAHPPITWLPLSSQ